MIEFRKTLVIGDFSMDATVNCPANKYVEIMNIKVPAQQIIFWGNGAITGGVDDRGTYKLNVKSAIPANIPGTSRLVVADANKVIRNFRREDRSEDLNSGIQLGQDIVGAKQDSYLSVEYSADTTTVATNADTTTFAPVTIRTL